MNASIRPDVNFCSITKDGYADPAHVGKTDFTDVDAKLYASIVKVSTQAKGVNLRGLKVPAGNETSVDCDWAEDCSFQGDFGLPGGDGVFADNVLRAKGPFKNIKFSGFIHSRGKRNGVDIELGNHYDQHPGLGRGADITGIDGLQNGERATFAVGWVVPFSTKYRRDYHEYLIWESIKLKVYVAAKHLVRWVLRIPRGVKGPSWM